MPDVSSSVGRPGEHVGESFLLGNLHLLYFTSNSWQSYDSIFSNTDSIAFRSLSYQNGLIYGVSSEEKISVSSDTGQTWAVGHPNPIHQHQAWLPVGAPDELWDAWPVWEDTSGDRACIYMLCDTGATVIPIDTLKVPYIPVGWHSWRVIPTDQPGEAYVLHEITTNSDASVTLFHIKDYETQIDSFYYYFSFLNAAEQLHPPVPSSISLSAYPNPFNASVRFMLETPSQGLRHLSIYDVLGRRVWEWQGYANEIIWQGTNTSGISLPSGKYWATINCNNRKQTTSVILLR